MAEFAQDMRFKVDLDSGLVPQSMRTILVQGDAYANRIVTELTRDGKPFEADGMTVVGAFMRPGDEARIDLEGAMENGEASVTLTDTCYEVSGQYTLDIILVQGEKRRTVLRIVGAVERRGNGQIVISGTLTNIDATLEEIRAAVENAEAVKNELQTFSDTHIAEIEQKGQQTMTAIEQKAAQTLETIPEEYTALDAEVKSLKDTNAAYFDRNVPDVVVLPASITTYTPTGQKQIFYESNAAVIAFNTTPHKRYKVTISGNNRFRFYGRTKKDPLHIKLAGWLMDEIIADQNSVSGIDSLKSYEFNAGENLTVYVYAVGGASTANLTYTVEALEEAKLTDAVTTRFPRSLFSLYNVEKLTDDTATMAAWTYQQLIDNVYEPLRAANPNYISRSVIGRDASDTYDIYQYTFAPDYPEQTAYLQAGVHPREELGYVGLALIMRMICNDWAKDDHLSYLRWAVKFVVVPVVNVWGVSQAIASRTDNNVNGVNLNRDCVKKTEAETIAVTGLTDSLIGKLSFALDFHTTVNDTYGDYMLTAWTGAKNEIVAKRTLYALARKNATSRIAEYLSKYSLGEHDLRLPNVGDSENTSTYAAYWHHKGIPCATVEHADFVFSGYENSETPATFAVECYLNQIIQHAEARLDL